MENHMENLAASNSNTTNPSSTSTPSSPVSPTTALVPSASAEGDHSHATPTGDSAHSSGYYTPSYAIPKTLKPVTELLTQFQLAFKAQSEGLLLTDPKFQQLINTYTQLNHLATIERINESLDQAGQGYKMPPLIRELNKAQSLQERAAARFSREQAAKDREARRIQREQDRKERELQRQEHQLKRDANKIRTAELKIEFVHAAADRREKAAADKASRNTKSPAPAHPATPQPMQEDMAFR